MHIGLCQLGCHNLRTILFHWTKLDMLHIVENYLDTATIKENPKFHKITLPHDIIFTKEDASTNDEHVEVLSRE